MPTLNSDTAGIAKLYELVPEIFNDKKLWSILLKEFIDVYIEDNVTEYIRRLDQIRWLSHRDRTTGLRVRTEDENMLSNTAGMLGFNLSFDVFESIKDKLLAHLTQLPLYHQTNGPGLLSTYTDSNGVQASASFINFISYVLGTPIKYNELWSNSINLIDYNRLVSEIPVDDTERTPTDNAINLNSWFKTTHIDLNIDISSLKVNLANKDRDGRTFDDRVKELFYGYSPINLVIHTILYNYTLKTNLSFVASLLSPETLFYNIGKKSKNIATASIFGANTVIPLTTSSYTLKIIYEDGNIEYVNADHWSTANSVLKINTNGEVTADTVLSNTNVYITAVLGSMISLKKVTVLAMAADPVVSCEIVGPDTIDEGGIPGSYNLKVNTLLGTTYSANSSTWSIIGFNSTIGTKAVSPSSRLTITIINITTDIFLTIVAKYTDNDGVEHQSQKTIQCIDYDPNRIDYLEIRASYDLPPEINLTAGNTYYYECYAVTMSGIRSIINPMWLTSDKSLVISNFGAVVVPIDVSYSYTTDLIATYTYGDNRRVNTSITLSISNIQVKPLSMAISGYGVNAGEYLVENSAYTYRAIVNWDNGDYTYSPAHWVATVFPVGVDTGILRTGLVDNDTTIILHAKVVFDGQTDSYPYYNPNPDMSSFPLLTASVNLNLISNKNLLSVVSLQIVGSNNILIPNYSRYYSYIEKNNSSTYPCASTWVVTDPETGNTLSHVNINVFSDPITSVYYAELSVTPNPLNYTLALDHPLIELVSTYVDNLGNTFVSKKLIYTLITDPIYNKVISNCEIVGPSSVMDHSRINYTTMITYTDGSTKTVKSLWNLEIPEQENDYIVAYIKGGTLTTRTVHGDTIVKLKAQHYTYKMEKTIIITDSYTGIIDTATCSYIEGPIQVCIGDSASYSLMVHWNNDKNPSRESGSWKLSDSLSYNYVWIDDEGNLNAFDNVQPPLTLLPDGTPYIEVAVTANYNCAATGDISKSIVVKILWCNDKVVRPGSHSLCSDIDGILQSVTIFGPSSVNEKSNTPYLLLGDYLSLDGTSFTKQLIADFWELDVNDYLYADINSTGDLVAKEINSNKNIILKACYTDSVTVTTYCDTHPVTILDTFTLNIVSVEIEGTVTMYESSTELFKLKIIMNDGSTTYATSNTVWMVTNLTPLPYYITTTQLSGNFTILAANLPLGKSSELLDLLAEYTLPDGTVLSDTHQVVITKSLSALRAVWGYGDFGGVDSTFIDAYIQTPFPQTSGHTFIVTNAQKYIYFCHPVSLGLATFSFSDNYGNTLVGGMDGATWPDGAIGYDYTPITITRAHTDGTTSNWYIYRSDFKSVSNYTVKVDYANA